MPTKSAHWTYTKNGDQITDQYLLGPDGGNVDVGAGMGARTLTVASSGANFSTLDDALAYRDTQVHVELATGLTGTITYTSGEDSRVITLTGTPLSSLLHRKGIIGVRLGGAGNPVIRGSIIASNQIQLYTAIAATFSGVQVDVYNIVPYGIAILPGEIIELPTSLTRYVPAFTTIFCPVPLGATVYHSDTVAGKVFNNRNDQNYISFRNLVFGDSTHKINSILFEITAGSATNNQTLCEYLVQDCEFHTASQDCIYSAAGATPSGAIHIINNRFSGTYDIINPGIWRNFDMRENAVSINSVGDYASGGGDGGSPTGAVFGGGTTHTYPLIYANIRDNTFEITGIPGALDEGVSAVGVEIRAEIPSQSVIDIQSNSFYCNKIGGSDGTYPATAGVLVSSFVGGTNTPTILVRNNTFDCKATLSGAGTAYSMHSENANYSIKRFGNFVKAGTLGSNTAAMTTV